MPTQPIPTINDGRECPRFAKQATAPPSSQPTACCQNAISPRSRPQNAHFTTCSPLSPSRGFLPCWSGSQPLSSTPHDRTCAPPPACITCIICIPPIRRNRRCNQGLKRKMTAHKKSLPMHELTLHRRMLAPLCTVRHLLSPAASSTIPPPLRACSLSQRHSPHALGECSILSGFPVAPPSEQRQGNRRSHGWPMRLIPPTQNPKVRTGK
jgi:hypothetical protein